MRVNNPDAPNKWGYKIESYYTSSNQDLYNLTVRALKSNKRIMALNWGSAPDEDDGFKLSFWHTYYQNNNEDGRQRLLQIQSELTIPKPIVKGDWL